MWSPPTHPAKPVKLLPPCDRNTLYLVSFVASSGLVHNTENQHKHCELRNINTEIMKILAAASLLATVLCLPEPEAGLGVEDMVILVR